jgi:ATP-dependent exoDNAse (exonuclease V) alpha subunit
MASLAEILAAKKQKALELQGTLHTIEETSRSESSTHTNTTNIPTNTTNITNTPIPTHKPTLAEILAAKTNIASQIPTIHIPTSILQTAQGEEVCYAKTEKETFSLNIKLNSKQLLAKELAFAGKSFCLVGAAGTGKTTAQREIAASLLSQNKLSTHLFRIQGTPTRVEAPSIAFVAYTRIAAGNLKRAIHKNPDLEAVLTHNVTTIHNLLEYSPEFYWDYETEKEKMRFVPKRTALNPLDITHLIIEESSMVGLKLWNELYEAMRPGTQIIFIGDINQLPPVMDKSILNYALVQLPVVELTHVYRQAEDSFILENAHKILRGEFPLTEGKDFKIMRNGTVQHTQARMARMIGEAFPKFYAQELLSEGSGYDPLQDIILSPFNKQDLGTDNLNKWIAQFQGTAREAVVYEIKAGIATLYLAVGDKVMYNKQVGEIAAISRNMEYHGKECKYPSPHLTRFGTYTASTEEHNDEEELVLAGYENIDLDKMMDENQKDDLMRSASHIVTLAMETGIDITLSAVGDFAPSIFSLGYALTVHKAQGCEWRKVFIVLHKDHSVMAFRELLYTAVTRSREQCILITKDFMLEKAIKNPRIKGNSVEEKIEYFNSGLMDIGNVYCTK